MNGRKRRVKSWLIKLNNDIAGYQKCFDFNLITKTDIGEKYYNDIVWKLNDLRVELDEIIFELESW